MQVNRSCVFLNPSGTPCKGHQQGSKCKQKIVCHLLANLYIRLNCVFSPYSSDDNVDKKNPSNSNDNKDGSDHKNLEINPENSNPTPSESKKEETEKNTNLATTFNTNTLPNPGPTGTC